MLEHFFGSKTRLKLLKIFFRSPERAFFVRELARAIDTQMHAVRREIANLETLHIIRQVDASSATRNPDIGTERSKFFQLNKESPLFEEIKALINKGEVLEEKQLIEEIQTKSGKLSLFLLTGMFTGDAEASTDILLVGDLKPFVIAKIIRHYEDDLGKTIRYTLMDETEFKDRRHIGDKFLYTLFECKHVFLVNTFNIS
jgi:hypothetical protein